tara:strand:- start:7872 stop:8636 length:765 start_codon:yes stop_codon:yes gene_type:complete
MGINQMSSKNILTGTIDAYKAMVAEQTVQLEEAKESVEEAAKLDPVDDKANDKKFADRKDKDIDNDGDTDSSDEYLHKKRAATDDAIDGGKKPAKKESVKEDFPPKKKDAKDGETEIEKDAEEGDTTLAKGEVEKGTKEVKKKKKPVANSKTDGDDKAEIAKIDSMTQNEAFLALWELMSEAVQVEAANKQDPASKAAAPEKVLSKSSVKAKKFADMHDHGKAKVVADDEEGHDMATKAGRATSKTSENKPKAK